MEAQLSPVVIASGLTAVVAWIISYSLMIRRSHIDKVYGMPLFGLAGNLSWEIIFGIIHPLPGVAGYTCVLYGIFDLVLLIQVVLYGRKEFPAQFSQAWFLPSLGFKLGVVFVLMLLAVHESGDWTATYSGWIQANIISGSFIYLLIRRNSAAGQSMYITLARLLGNLITIPATEILIPVSPLLRALYILNVAMDIIYTVMLYKVLRRDGINPWTRV